MNIDKHTFYAGLTCYNALGNPLNSFVNKNTKSVSLMDIFINSPNMIHNSPEISFLFGIA